MAQSSQFQGGNDDLIQNILEWQSQQQNIQSTYDEDKALEYLEIPRLSSSLLSLFKEVILSLREQATIPNDVRISLERSCSALILWSDGYGIAEGHLNDILKRSSKLRYTLLKNLSLLGRALTDRTYAFYAPHRKPTSQLTCTFLAYRFDTFGRHLIREATAAMLERRVQPRKS